MAQLVETEVESGVQKTSEHSLNRFDHLAITAPFTSPRSGWVRYVPLYFEINMRAMRAIF